VDASDALAAQKTALRDRLLTARRRRSVLEMTRSAAGLADVLTARPEVRRAATVAAYVSVDTEPGTGPLLECLVAAGRRVLLPVVTRELDLDWAAYDGRLVRARMGLLEPDGPLLGLDAVGTADAVLLPGLAVGRDGLRLGRGAGCYDRALGRVPVGTFTCVLLYDEEVLDQVPAGPHDRAVTAVATPSGVTPLPAPG
jgi:5-formyltetrahydrofolate cyclo-ligase